jgi:rod shape determining protein RodA
MNDKISSNFDFYLLAFVLILICAGLIGVFAATNTTEPQSSQYFPRQMMHVALGLTLMFIVAFLPMNVLQQTSYLFYGISIFFLLLIDLFGVTKFGAERWLEIGGFRMQPSEFAKLATVLAISNYLSTSGVNVNQFKHLAVTIILLFVPFALIIGQPDLGTSLVFIALTIPILFWAGLNLFALFMLISPVVTLLLSFNFYAFLVWMLIIIGFLYLSGRKFHVLAMIFVMHIAVGIITPTMWSSLRPYQQKRILTFMNPEADPRGAGYQIIQSKVAIGSGGIWGKGFLNGTQTQLNFLPAQHTDFILSVIGEEWGFTGVIFILIMFLILLLYLVYLSSVMRSTFARISTIGISTILFFHIVINIGMTVGLAPVTGLPLPLISYGGSFLLLNMLMIGYVLNFSRNRYKV